MFLIPSLKNSLENTWYWGRGGEWGERRRMKSKIRGDEGRKRRRVRTNTRLNLSYPQKQTFDLQGWTSSFTATNLMVGWRAKKKHEKDWKNMYFEGSDHLTCLPAARGCQRLRSPSRAALLWPMISCDCDITDIAEGGWRNSPQRERIPSAINCRQRLSGQTKNLYMTPAG